MSDITVGINSALQIIRGIKIGTQSTGPNSDLPHYERNMALLDKERQIQNTEDRLLKALESGDDTLYDTLINPATGRPYTEAEKAEALQNAINREIDAIESNRPIHPDGQARLDELRERSETNKVANESSSSNPDNKDTTISMADDDDGVRVEHKVFSTEDAVYSEEWGNDNANASIDVLGYEAEAGAFAEVGMDEVEVGAYASASAHAVSGEAGIGAGPLNGGIGGSVGVQASADVNIEVDLPEGTIRGEIGGEVFAGAEARAAAGIDAGVAGAEVGAEVKAGIGAEFEADVGLEDGEFNASFDFGAAFGVGAGFDVDVSLDIGGMFEKELTGSIKLDND